MEVLKITPRGYCHGVVDAFRIAKRVREETQGPVHMLGMLVHNTHATDDLQAQGIALVDQPNRLAGLEHIKDGTVIFTAHGVSPQVKERAVELGLRPVDATCSDVVRTHELVADLARKGYEVVYIGRKGHPEPEGVMGEAPGKVHLVQDPQDIDALDLQGELIAITCQTTLSVWDTEDLIGRVKSRYPQAEVYNEICRATQERQEAAVEAAKEVDLVIVVGSPRSSNSLRLVEVVKKLGHKPAYLVDNLEDIDIAWFAGTRKVGVTSGASTPTQLTRRVIEYLARSPGLGPSEPAQHAADAAPAGLGRRRGDLRRRRGGLRNVGGAGLVLLSARRRPRRPPAAPPSRRPGGPLRLGGRGGRGRDRRRLGQRSAVGPRSPAPPSPGGGDLGGSRSLLHAALPAGGQVPLDLGPDLAFRAQGAVGRVHVDAPDHDRRRRAADGRPLLGQSPAGVDRVSGVDLAGKLPAQPLPLGHRRHRHVDRA